MNLKKQWLKLELNMKVTLIMIAVSIIGLLVSVIVGEGKPQNQTGHTKKQCHQVSDFVLSEHKRHKSVTF